VVKLKKGGKKFEIAAYPNKVKAWLQGIEKDRDEVLQSEMVYTNVSRGETAKKKDLLKCFGTDDLTAVIDEILQKGQLQESEKEREQAQENMFKEITTIVLEKCINSETKRPMTYGYLERIIKELNFQMKPDDSAKKQALKLIQILEKSDYNVERAPMQVLAHIPDDDEAFRSIEALVISVDSSTISGAQRVVKCQVDPSSYRELDKVVTKQLKGHIEVVQLAVKNESDGALMEQVASIEPVPEKKAAKKETEGFSSATAPGVVFPTREAMREHMKSDWHKFNLKRKTHGVEMLTYEQYQEACVDDAFFS